MLLNKLANHCARQRVHQSVRVGGARVPFATVLLVLFMHVPVPAGAAQPNQDADRARPTSATLPESNEALLLSTRIQSAVENGDYRLCVELVDQLLRLDGELVGAPHSRTYYPLWRQAFRIMDEIPPEGAEVFQQLNDGAIGASFAEARSAVDVAALRDLFRNARLSAHFAEIGTELARQQIEFGEFGAAIETLRELERAEQLNGRVRLLYAMALAAAGATASAEAQLALAETQAAGNQERIWRITAIRSWIDTDLKQAAATNRAERRCDPALGSGEIWSAVVPEDCDPGSVPRGADFADLIHAVRKLPLHTGVQVGEALIFRLGGGLACFDLATLQMRWQASERGSRTRTDDTRPAWERRGELSVAPDAALLFEHALRHSVSADQDNAYSVESIRLDASSGLDRLGRMRGAGRFADRNNELVARSVQTGTLRWSTGSDPARPLFSAEFQQAPLVHGDRLFALYRLDDELCLGELDPRNGNLLNHVTVVGPPNEFPAEGGRAWLLADESALYVCTGNGVVAAFGVDLSWKWASIYPSSLAAQLGQMWFQERNDTVPSIDPPIISGDLLVTAPVDASPPAFIAFDRFSGAERWSVPRREYPYLLGASECGVIVAGTRVVSLDPADPLGKPPLWRSVPLRLSGRAAVQGDRVYLPTARGIVVLDANDGRVVASQRYAQRQNTEGALHVAPPEVAANLVVTPTALVSISAHEVVKYPDPQRARRYWEERDAGARGRVALAWLDIFAGQFEAARDGLRDLGQVDASVRLSANAALTQAYLGLARGATDARERMGWLNAAVPLAADGAQAAQLALLLGESLESAGEYEAAYEHYVRLLASPSAAALLPVGKNTEFAAWLRVQQRLSKLAERLSRLRVAAVADRVLADLSRAERDAIVIARWAAATRDAAVRTRLLTEVLLSDLAPELKDPALRAIDPVGDAYADRVELHLARWDVNVSLGRRYAAQRDEAMWDELAREVDVPVAARERADILRISTRKLAAPETRAFSPTLRRQWKISGAELLLTDTARLIGDWPWMLLADLDERRLSLINGVRHQHAYRETEDGIVRAGRGDQELVARKAASGRRSRARDAWTATMYGSLAGVPVPGGLVGVGLGPERYAGKRLWQYAIPSWDVLPDSVGQRLVASEGGVCFAPRRDRVVCVSWLDGTVAWSHVLPGVEIERLERVGDWLVVIANDTRVWRLDLRTGAKPVAIETPGRVRELALVEDLLVCWGDVRIEARRVVDGSLAWRRPAEPAANVYRIPGRPWLAWRGQQDWQWYVLNAASGDPVFDASIGRFERLTAAHASDQRLFVAGMTEDLLTGGEAQRPRIGCHDLTTGETIWQIELPSEIVVNASQLAAHPTLIPVLLTPGDNGILLEESAPALQLIGKSDGTYSAPRSLQADYRPQETASCEPFVFAERSRIIVQVAGNLMAYGDAALDTER